MNKDEFTNQELFIPVGSGHKLYVVDWGNKTAEIPIICLHGGPGGSVKDRLKPTFDPHIQRVIFFDQRGCGKSTPTGSRIDNTTEELANDITKIAKTLKIKKFYLYGYSWGSTLALYYAIAHPEMLAGLVIGGVFSGSKNEIFGMFDLAKIFYPDLWDKALLDTPAAHQSDPIAYHLDKSLNGTKSEQKKSTFVLDYLESGLANFDDRVLPEPYAEYDPISMQIELDYIANNCFMPENFILYNASRISVPVHIVQGRFDMVCSPDFAHKPSKLIRGCKIYMTISNHMPDHEIVSVIRAIFAGL